MVIPNWEKPDFTIRSANALLQEGVSADRIVVVDNGSGDDSLACFERELPRVT